MTDQLSKMGGKTLVCGQWGSLLFLKLVAVPDEGDTHPKQRLITAYPSYKICKFKLRKSSKKDQASKTPNNCFVVLVFF